MTEAERTIYETVEDHIASTCSRASGKERTAVGFVMTTFRDRYGAVGFGACAGAELSRIGTFGAGTIIERPERNPISALRSFVRICVNAKNLSAVAQKIWPSRHAKSLNVRSGADSHTRQFCPFSRNQH